MSEYQQKPSLPKNPETAFHAEALHQERQRVFRYALLALFISAILLFACCLLVFVIVLARGAVPAILWIMLVLVLLPGIAGTIIGIGDLRFSRRPIEGQEVQRRRQRTRTELLRRAQGYVPFQYRRSAMAMEMLGAGLLCVMGVGVVIVGLTLLPLWINVAMGVFCVLVGVFLFYDALVMRPFTAKHLAVLSADELSRRLTLGEVTEGQTSEE